MTWRVLGTVRAAEHVGRKASVKIWDFRGSVTRRSLVMVVVKVNVELGRLDSENFR